MKILLESADYRLVEIEPQDGKQGQRHLKMFHRYEDAFGGCYWDAREEDDNLAEIAEMLTEDSRFAQPTEAQIDAASRERKLIEALVVAMIAWGSDEDGIPEGPIWSAYASACLYLGWATSGPAPCRAAGEAR